MGAQLMPVGAMRHVAGAGQGCGPGQVSVSAWAQRHTNFENTPFTGLPTGINKRFAEFNRAHEAGACKGGAGFHVQEGQSRRNQYLTGTHTFLTVIGLCV